MNMKNTWSILHKELVMGPRNGMLLWIIAMPLIITFVVRLVFGGLIEPAPRLGIVDLGSSGVPAAIERLGGIEVTKVDSTERLERMVETNHLDAGLVLQRGFDGSVLSGSSPELRFFVGGESLATNRIILAVSTIDAIRSVAGQPSPVHVVTRTVGSGTSVPFSERMVPLLVFLAVALGGIFLPAASIIQERETRTMEAILTTPTTVGELMVAKGIFGYLLAFLVGALTLLMNSGFTASTGAYLVVLAVASLMTVQLGLALGAAAKDMATMFSIWKSAAIVVFAPAVLFLFPGVPEWIARIFPTYYFLGPLYHMLVDGAPLRAEVANLAIGVGVSAILAVAAAGLARRMETKIAVA